jgi:hypothetical protein
MYCLWAVEKYTEAGTLESLQGSPEELPKMMPTRANFDLRMGRPI